VQLKLARSVSGGFSGWSFSDSIEVSGKSGGVSFGGVGGVLVILAKRLRREM